MFIWTPDGAGRFTLPCGVNDPTEPVITGYGWRDCGDDDTRHAADRPCPAPHTVPPSPPTGGRRWRSTAATSPPASRAASHYPTPPLRCRCATSGSVEGRGFVVGCEDSRRRTHGVDPDLPAARDADRVLMPARVSAEQPIAARQVRHKVRSGRVGPYAPKRLALHPLDEAPRAQRDDIGRLQGSHTVRRYNQVNRRSDHRRRCGPPLLLQPELDPALRGVERTEERLGRELDLDTLPVPAKTEPRRRS